MNGIRKIKKKISYLNLKKSRGNSTNNSKSRGKKFQNYVKRNQNTFMSFSNINKSLFSDSEKKNIKSSRNIKITNPIPSLNLNIKNKK